MNRWPGGRSSALPAMWSGPAISGSSAFNGTNTAEPLFTVWSTPWSKNCPKNVNSELYGGDSPTSVVTFGMNSVLCDGVQPAGTPTIGVGTAVGSGSVVHGTTPVLPCVRTGLPAAAIAAGFVDVWSTIRLLIVRGCESKTSPFFCLYDVGPVGPKPGGTGSASRKLLSVRRGNVWSAAAKVSRPGNRLLQEP